MATIHFILQGKGGVGKSMVASLLYQALEEKGQNVLAYDTDPVNSTLGGYKEFTVTRIELMQHGDIVPRQFDILFQGLVDAPANSHVIVDNGASSFVALGRYLNENDVVQVLKDEGHKVYFHTVITGGQAMGDTFNGLSHIIAHFANSSIVVWLNPFFGEIAINDKQFEEMKLYKDNANLLQKIIKLPPVPPSTLGKDLEELFAKRYSFRAGMVDSTANVAIRSRLRRYWGQILEMISAAFAEDISVTPAPAESPAPETEASNA